MKKAVRQYYHLNLLIIYSTRLRIMLIIMLVTMGKWKLKFFRWILMSPGSLPRYFRYGIESLKTMIMPTSIIIMPIIISIFPNELCIIVICSKQLFHTKDDSVDGR